jgi:hypothetical protein
LVDDMYIVSPISNVIFVFFMIIIKVCSIKAFSATNKMCILISIRVGQFYHFLLAFLFLTWDFKFWAHQWGPNHLLSCLFFKFFMKIWRQYFVSLCLQIFRRLLQYFHCAMPSTLATCFVQCFHLQVCCSITLSLIFVHNYVEKVIWCGVFRWFY